MSRSQSKNLGVVFLAIGCFLAGVVIVMVLRLGDQVERSNDRLDQMAQAYDAARQTNPDRADLPTADEIISGLELPPATPGRDGRDGRDGVDGNTPACYFTVEQCVGRPPTAPEIFDQVSVFLTANPPAPGRDGRDGIDGGPGPPPSDEDLDAAIARYCTTHQCQGDPGANGTNAPMCPEGYSMQPDQLRGDEVMVCTLDQ